MSQFFTNLSGSNLPSNIPTTFTENSGTAIPAANNLNIVGSNGIQTSGSGSTVTIGYNGNTLTTTDATPTSILSFTPTNNSAQAYQFLIVCYDSANGLCFGGQLLGVAKLVSGTATAIELPVELFGGDAALNNVDYSFISSGPNIIVQVQGIVGHTLDWAIINAAGVVTAT
jgi:hypothetical protein